MDARKKVYRVNAPADEELRDKIERDSNQRQMKIEDDAERFSPPRSGTGQLTKPLFRSMKPSGRCFARATRTCW